LPWSSCKVFITLRGGSEKTSTLPAFRNWQLFSWSRNCLDLCTRSWSTRTIWPYFERVNRNSTKWLVESSGFYRRCVTFRIAGFLDYVHRPEF
jgi:hypothetical protein